MEGPQWEPVAYFHLSIEAARNTAARGLREVTAGAHPQVTTTKTSCGDSVRHASFLMEVIQMVTAVISLSCIKVQYTQPAPLTMHPSPGVLPRTTMILTNSGAIVEVRQKNSTITLLVICINTEKLKGTASFSQDGKLSHKSSKGQPQPVCFSRCFCYFFLATQNWVSKTHATLMGIKIAVPFANIFIAKRHYRLEHD